MGQPGGMKIPPSLTEYIGQRSDTCRTETSQQAEEKKSKEIPIVAASEVGRAQTTISDGGVVGPTKRSVEPSRTIWKDRQDRVIAPQAKGKIGKVGT